MTLTGDAAKKFLAGALASAARTRADQIAAAKADAEARGKQPFDLAALEALCDLSRDGRLAPPDELRTEHEWMYYVRCTSLMTLAEYAERVTEQSRW
jgi:hypothetical protein